MNRSARSRLRTMAVTVVLVSGAAMWGGSLRAANDYHGYRIVSMVVDGKVVQSDVPPIIMDGRTLVPARALAEALGATVRWNSETYVLEITSAKPGGGAVSVGGGSTGTGNPTRGSGGVTQGDAAKPAPTFTSDWTNPDATARDRFLNTKTADGETEWPIMRRGSDMENLNDPLPLLKHTNLDQWDVTQGRLLWQAGVARYPRAKASGSVIGPLTAKGRIDYLNFYWDMVSRDESDFLRSGVDGFLPDIRFSFEISTDGPDGPWLPLGSAPAGPTDHNVFTGYYFLSVLPEQAQGHDTIFVRLTPSGKDKAADWAFKELTIDGGGLKSPTTPAQASTAGRWPDPPSPEPAWQNAVYRQVAVMQMKGNTVTPDSQYTKASDWATGSWSGWASLPQPALTGSVMGPFSTSDHSNIRALQIQGSLAPLVFPDTNNLVFTVEVSKDGTSWTTLTTIAPKQNTFKQAVQVPTALVSDKLYVRLSSTGSIPGGWGFFDLYIGLGVVMT